MKIPETIQAHRRTVKRTAHYYTLGEASEQTRYFIFACHGYGQAASRFIRKFESIARPDVFVLAPEGLSRFYWGGITGDVVASWMTSGDRLEEISDFCAYLQELYDAYLSQLPADVKVILFGFSQGCATQVRWMMKHHPRFQHLILWAGALPDDLDYTEDAAYFNAQKIAWIYGTDDPLVSAKGLQKQLDIMKRYQLQFEISTFKGKHQVDRKVLQELFKPIFTD